MGRNLHWSIILASEDQHPAGRRHSGRACRDRALVGASRAGADAHADAVMPAIREAKAAGAKSLREIAAALNDRGIATARGGKWEATTVRNIRDFVGWPAINAETKTRRASRRIPVKLERYAIKAMRVVINSIILT